MPRRPKSQNLCPVDIDEIAEQYIMGRLSPVDALGFEKHLTACRPCAVATEKAEQFVRAMKEAALRSKAKFDVKLQLASSASFIRITPLTLGGAFAEMRFYRTVHETPRASRPPAGRPPFND